MMTSNEMIAARVSYWQDRYLSFLNKKTPQEHQWLLESVCYSPWPYLFNQVMDFFEKYVVHQSLSKHRVDLKNKVVLDMGCGTGRWCYFFKRLKARVRGLDIAWEILSHNRNRLPDVHFLASSLIPLAIKTSSIDFLSVMITLEYIPNSQKPDSLSELHRVLTDQGMAIILDPVTDGSARESDEFSGLSPESWKNLLTRAGFAVLDEKYLHAYPLERLFRDFKKWTGDTLKRLRKNPAAPFPLQSSLGLSASKEPSVQTSSEPKWRHRLYHHLDQLILKIIALISFPLEFLWLAMDWKGSHKMFLIRKTKAVEYS